MIDCAKLWEEVEWVDPAEGIAAKFEMQMGAGAIAGAAHPADYVALGGRLSTTDIDLAQMGVEALPAVSMIKNNGVAIAPVIPSGVNHDPVIGSVNPTAGSAANINRFVNSRYVWIPGYGRVRGRPAKGAVSGRTI